MRSSTANLWEKGGDEEGIVWLVLSLQERSFCTFSILRNIVSRTKAHGEERTFMRLAIFCGVVVVMVLIGIPASAQVPTLVLYDNFETKVLDSNKWFGKESSDAGLFTLESVRQIKTEPLFGFRGLDILNRSYASEGLDDGNSVSYTRLLFPDGNSVSTIQAVVLVKKIQATGCSTNTFATAPRLRIGGMFFNPASVTPPDSTNDVLAFITVGRESDSENPSGVLDILGSVRRCGDATCSGANTTQIGEELLGTVNVNQKIKLRVTWDPGNNRFVFQKGKGPEVSIGYADNDGFPPGTANGGNKRLEVQHQIPNCASGASRPIAYMEAYFDDIKVNVSDGM